MRIVIVGIGKVGRALAEHLSREGHDVAVIDNRPGMAERLAEELDVLGIEGNGAAYTVQQQARASQADLVIAATSEDEVNMIACMTAKKLGAKNTIARVRSVEYESQLRFMQQEMGLSLSINPPSQPASTIPSPGTPSNTFFLMTTPKLGFHCFLIQYPLNLIPSL